ncbi:E3 SUMO-protein ligase RanBP2 [Plutella xylostella]|uniref:E3 SUMO-protein ligase RanBP2 n=1 Tax=Plutella xylostella TaxID=51655 RepID=UPI00203283BE|nr:E3 SUMO-protein ligase RanBP2 [Plutella xylostella]
MYRNKKDVDKHVEGMLAKLSLKEFKSRAYSVARLYFEVGDYVSCQRYVEQYLSQKDNNAAAHKLLGQTLQKLGQKEKALEQYKISLDIDPTQTSLILEICELLADDEVFIDPGRAKYWCEKAEATFPRHPVTFRLRERLMASSNPDPEALVSLLTAELAVRPKDPTLHARLLKHYLQSNKIKEAFEHSCNVEFGGDTFLNNIAWYESLAEILKHNSLNTKDWLYQVLCLTVRERLCCLSLTDLQTGTPKGLLETSDLLHQYDQAIETICKAGAPPKHAEFHAGLLQHHRGQLALHLATLVLKKAKKDQLNWKEATRVASPLMLIAWHTVPLDTKVSWLSHAPQKLQTAVHRWFIEGSYRCSQAGHYLLANTQEKSQTFLDAISQTCSNKNWRDKLYEKIFATKDHMAKMKSSYFVSGAYSEPVLRLPRKTEVEAYDVEAQRQHPNSLHHFVWILKNYKNFAQFQCSIFDMLTPKTRNYMNSGPETLNKMDIFAFLYTAAITAQHQKSYLIINDPHKPKVLPANITDLLCPLAQMKWWDCAYKFSQNLLGSELSDIRTTLSRGIEVIRCVDNHGLDPEVLCTLGRIFSERARNTTAVEEKNNLEARAGLYYGAAIPLLEKLKSKIVIKVPERRLFDYTHKEMSNKDINALLEESKIYVAVNYLNDSEYEKALETLSNLKSSQAFFHLSQIYKKMALDEQSVTKDSTDNETKFKYAALLGKAKSYAYKTLDILKENHDDNKNKLYADTQELIEEIETNMNKVDPDLSGNIHDKYSSDENVSSGGSEHVTVHNNSHMFRNLSSTPKHPAANSTNYRTAVDSQLFETTRNDQKYLERIENQIKGLQKRDSTINSFMEQTKGWFDENRSLSNQIISTINSNIQNTTDQFKLLKISVDQVKDQIDECRSECKDVGELKKQVAELKREVSKLKKASSETNIDDSDLYMLDEEYRSNEGSSLAAQLPFTPPVMPPFNQRLVPPFGVPPNPYLYGHNLYGLYNQYSQFPQPGAPPMFDPSRGQVYPGMYATPEQMFPDIAHLIPTSVAPPAPSIPPVPAVPPAPAPAPAPRPPAHAPAPAAVPKDSSRSLPVNVVITSSDPLPTATTAPQPVLSVTIPPKHIKGTPHNYQIAMPAISEPNVSFTSGFLASTVSTSTAAKPFSSWNQANVFKTAQSSISSPKANVSADKPTFSLFDGVKPSSADNSLTVVDGNITNGSPNTSLNKSRTLSERSNTSVENYDPCPDFKPIVPLPAEIKVTTGEEDETAVFSARSKLFRFVDNQWKERGIGEMKLLKHKVTGKVRVLMRREQVHKICANHLITPELDIQPMKNEAKAYFWAANDFADESLVFEKFCVRFKTAEIAKQFYEAFEKARKEAKSAPTPTKKEEKPKAVTKPSTPVESNKKETPKPTETAQSNKTVVGGFVFSGTPVFKAVAEEKPEAKPVEAATTKANPFSALSFKSTTSSPFSNLFNVTSASAAPAASPATSQDTSKLNTSDTVEEYEPTVEFKPVVPLPALVETRTGEEDETVLYEHRAKLLRYEASSKEWKERGLGNIKILAQKNNPQKIRLLMRREQVMKVCCNHQLTKELVFTKMPNMDKAVTWCAKDFSEGELVTETFCLRFKTAQVCNDFMAAVKSAQETLKDDTKIVKEQQNEAKQSNAGGFGDKFKPKAGSWSCGACYTNNLESFTKCACCEQPKPQSGKVESAPAAAAPTGTLNWGDQFKPKPGSWSCKECYVRNEGTTDYCTACNSPKDPSMPKKENKPAENTIKFSFGIPAQTAASIKPAEPAQTTTPVKGWGDKFKPKEGSWECKQCFVRNEPSSAQCSACTSPKDPNAVKKEQNSIFDSVASGPKFNFGIPAAAPASNNTEKPKSEPASIFDGTGGNKFSFGIPSAAAEKPAANVFGNIGATSVIFATPKKPDAQASPLDLIKKNDSLSITPVKPALLPTPQKDAASFGGKEGGTFDFVFKPKTPAKGKSPVKSPQAEESDDNEYASEDEGHHLHFSPVVPLPDKVEVVTGEEDELELYGHRAKLFRFISGEWKERGIGVVKVLKHKDTGKLRVVMRREQVLKICLNHALTADVVYTAKDDKTWLFAANDFSEGTLNLQQFCLRFKTKEIATDFKDAVDKALGGKSGSETKKDSDSDEVVFVSEMQPTAEEKKKAKELMLPENFYNYKYKDACKGCRGCEACEDKAPAGGATPAAPAPAAASPATPATLAKTSTNSTPTFFSPSTSVYGTPANFNKTVDNSIFRTPLESIGSNTNKSTPFFGTANKNTSNDKENAQKTGIFGGAGDQASTPPQAKNQNDSESTPTPTKNSSILAAPRLSALNTPKDGDAQKEQPKSIFSSQPASTQQSFFGTNTSTPSIFGNQVISDKNLIFGSDATNGSNARSIFSAANNANKPTFAAGIKNLFGKPETNSPSSEEDKKVFGMNKNNENAPDNTSNNTQAPVQSIFGSSPAQTPNLFSNPVQGSLFGPSQNNSNSGGSIFGKSGGSLFGNSTGNIFSGGKSLFGSGANQSADLIKNETTSLFGNKTETKENKAADKDGPFKVDNTLSFAALSSSEPGFGTQKTDNFKWEGAGSQLFTAAQRAAQERARDESAADEEADEEYDPHYEPIVPLPDKIVVTTGEEDEEKIFGERCKLYRYDEKCREWKERGVGELKLLHHPARSTYRLLLRREQVHKAVLNMLLFMDLELLPLKNSDRAWTWAGVNYAEAGGEQETLAVRFKTVDLATSFKDKIVECVRKLQVAAAQAIRESKESGSKPTEEKVAPLRLPKHLETDSRADLSANSQGSADRTQDSTDGAQNVVAEEEVNAEYDYDAEHYEDYENYEDYYNEDEDAVTYYSCEGAATVSQGDHTARCPEAQVHVMYDQELYSPKILVMDAATGEILADMLIHTDTHFQMEGESCTWSGTDYTTNQPLDKTVSVRFPDADTASQFYNSCETSKAATVSSTDPES